MTDHEDDKGERTFRSGRFEDRLLEAILGHHESVVSQSARFEGDLRRRHLGRVALAGAAAVIVAAGVLVGVGEYGGTGPKIVLDARTVAYHTSTALEQAQGYQIEEVRTVLTNDAGKMTSVVETWNYQAASCKSYQRIEVLNADGSPSAMCRMSRLVERSKVISLTTLISLGPRPRIRRLCHYGGWFP